MDGAHKRRVIELSVGYQPRGAIRRKRLVARGALGLQTFVSGCTIVCDELAVMRGGCHVSELSDLSIRHGARDEVVRTRLPQSWNR
jgi:hypothetical protein